MRHISRTPGSPFWPGQPGAEFQPTDLRGVDHPAEEVHQMALANLQGEYATIIDTEAAAALLTR